MYLHFTPRMLQWCFPDLLWHKAREAKTIYLTFDDGPLPQITPKVLAILAEWNAKATFFCVGENVYKHPEVLKQVVAQGHQVGNHTYHHVKGWQVATDIYMQELQQCQDQIKLFLKSNQKPLFRPPYGRFTKAQRRQITQNYTVVMWDVLSADYDQQLSREACLHKSIRYTRPGSIIVFHDSLKAWERLQWVLPRYLAHFSKQGYTFAAL